MAVKGRRSRQQKSVIIRKHEIVEGSRHGGAWKVAYADFVTAMMAFFLLMWLLNATTEDQRRGLADYFSPANVLSHNSSGSGQPFGGHTAFDDGALVSDRGKVDVTYGKQPVIDQTEDGNDPVHDDYHRARSGDGVGIGPVHDDQDADDNPDPNAKGQKGNRNVPGPGGPGTRTQPGAPAAQGAAQQGTAQAAASSADVSPIAAPSATRAAQEQAAVAAATGPAAQEQAAFQNAAEQIRQAVQSDPALAEIAKQIKVDMTPAGMRVQIMDALKLPMFATGSARPNDRVKLLLQKVLPILIKLKGPISIAGYTDAQPYPGPDRTNWELSADRANATRRMLVEGGFPEARIQSVVGHADHDLLLPNDPFAAANRRIAILVMRQTSPSAAAPKP
jgi:chemotaxis protein MotB